MVLAPKAFGPYNRRRVIDRGGLSRRLSGRTDVGRLDCIDVALGPVLRDHAGGHGAGRPGGDRRVDPDAGAPAWYASLTLSTPDSVSGPAWLWPVLLGLAGVLVLAIVHQGPGRAIRQLLDIPGHLRLFSAAMGRLKRAGRLIAVIAGVSVVCWTVSQTFSYVDPQGREDLTLLLKGRRLVSVAVEEGVLAGASPLRDIVGLGNLIPLLIASGVLVFQFSSDRWGSVDRVISPRATRLAAWGTVGWGATALYATYRTIGLFYGATDLPMGKLHGGRGLRRADADAPGRRDAPGLGRRRAAQCRARRHDGE